MGQPKLRATHCLHCGKELTSPTGKRARIDRTYCAESCRVQGAEETFRRNGVGLLYFEFIFSDMYKGLPRFDEMFRHLVDRGFQMVSIYELRHQNNLASWGDALFVNREYYRRAMAAKPSA